MKSGSAWLDARIFRINSEVSGSSLHQKQSKSNIKKKPFEVKSTFFVSIKAENLVKLPTFVRGKRIQGTGFLYPYYIFKYFFKYYL